MKLRLHCVAVTTLLTTAALSATPPIESFARRPAIRAVTISADGRYIAYLSGVGDDTVVMTIDRSGGGARPKQVAASEPDKFDIGWCRWANEKRLLCGLYGNIRGKKYAEPPYKRLFGIDADGTALKVLEKPRNDGNLLGGTTSMRNLNMNYGASVSQGNTPTREGLYGQANYYGSAVASSYVSTFKPERQDDVIDLTPNDHDTVLIQADDDRNLYPSIFKLNIYNGQRVQVMGDKPPILSFMSDGRGNPGLGWGPTKTFRNGYFVRLDEGKEWWKSEWRPLDVSLPVGATGAMNLVAFGPDNSAYAIGALEGRNAVWSVDLTGAKAPTLLFKNAQVDAGEPIVQSNLRLLGVRYDLERPAVWYADPKMTEIVDKLERRTVTQVFDIVDASAGMNALVVRASGPADDGTWYIYDSSQNQLTKLGSAYPELDPQTLGTMTPIVYKATDGTQIPGYLTVPTGAAKKNLPLVVMPHDGPAARDTWKFSFLRTFLASRGYAVLQMNYRGSTGYGQTFSMVTQSDWGSTVYSDIQDATRWAVSEGIADPKRICIMGWGFGGYEALQSAARNGDAYRCVASINGIVDMAMQQQHAEVLGIAATNKEFVEREESRGESPLANAAQIKIPVLLIHGTKDWQVQMDHSKAMDAALEKNKTKVKTVLITGAGHDLDRKEDRVTLLTYVDAFLLENLGAP
jgi:dipeptidyl aminopeptidase/acylaminoacyl peptidase